IQGRTGFNQEGINAKKEFGEPKYDQENQTESSNITVNEINNNVVDNSYSEATQISEEQDLESNGVIDSSKSMEIENGSNSNMHSLISKVPIPIVVEDKQDTTGFNSEGTDAKKEDGEERVNQEKQTKSSNRIDEAVSLIDLFTHDQITKHISSFGEQSNQVRTPTSCVFNFIDLFRHYCYVNGTHFYFNTDYNCEQHMPIMCNGTSLL
ncbi:histone acetyltransferase, partial [Trifolium pratense]